MNTIKIFLASSLELKEERVAFEIFCSRLNSRLVKEGLYLNLIIWEDFIDSMSQTRKQDDYNLEILKCDIFISLYFSKVGKYTEEEFDIAYNSFMKGGKPKFIYVYFKNANIQSNAIDDSITSLLNFKKRIHELGHFYNEFNNKDELVLHFNNQFEKLKKKLISNGNPELQNDINRNIISEIKEENEAFKNKIQIPPKEIAIPKNIAKLKFNLIEIYSSSKRFDDSFIYEFELNGIKKKSTIATKNDWISLSIPLDTNHEICNYNYAPPLDTEIPHEIALFQEEQKQYWLDKGNIWNDTIFRLTKLQINQQNIKANFAPHDFFDYKFSMGLLEQELVAFTNHHAEQRISLSQLPLRNYYLPNKNLLDIRQNNSSGILVLTAFARENDYAILVQERSTKVTDQKGAISVIPQCFHTPIQKGKKLISDNEAKISQSVYRELYEELFGGEEIIGKQEGPMDLEYFFLENKFMKWIQQNKQKITLELVACGVYLMTGDYDFAVLFAIHDNNFWDQFLKGNERGGLVFNWESESQIKFISSKDVDGIEKLVDSSEWSGEGIFSFIEGINRLKAIDKERKYNRVSADLNLRIEQ